MERLVLITDSLTGPPAQNRPAIVLAEELSREFKVEFYAPCMDDGEIKELLSGFTVKTNKPRCGYWYPGQATIENLLPKIDWGWVGDALTINFSNQLPVPSGIYYFQGFLSEFSRDFRRYWQGRELKFRVSVALIGHPIFKLVDWVWARALRGSKAVVANSILSANQLAWHNVRVDGVVEPPINRWLIKEYIGFEPPSDREYVLLHIGKETVLPWALKAVKAAIDELGSRVKAVMVFGAKFNTLPAWFIRGLGSLGRDVIQVSHYVREREMPKIYGEALLTVFTYNHEPYGYVPIESLMAGTPAIAIGPDGHGPYYTALRYRHAAWLPPGFTPEDVKAVIRRWGDLTVPIEERQEVALHHDPSEYAGEMLRFIESLLG